MQARSDAPETWHCPRRATAGKLVAAAGPQDAVDAVGRKAMRMTMRQARCEPDDQAEAIALQDREALEQWVSRPAAGGSRSIGRNWRLS
jgi:hypothetical protein